MQYSCKTSGQYIAGIEEHQGQQLIVLLRPSALAKL